MENSNCRSGRMKHRVCNNGIVVGSAALTFLYIYKLPFCRFLEATVLDYNLNIVTTEIVNFDSELPHYTKEGVYRDPSVNGRIVSPTLMWVEAFDLILERLQKKLDFGKIAAVSGSGQQHGSVYWKTGSSKILSSLDSKKPLVGQFPDAFSVSERLHGWTVALRNNAKLLRKLLEVQWSCLNLLVLVLMIDILVCKFAGYMKRNQMLVWSLSYWRYYFMASILIGSYACIDQTDGAGMNLMDIKQRSWSKNALEVTAPNLEGN